MKRFKNRIPSGKDVDAAKMMKIKGELVEDWV